MSSVAKRVRPLFIDPLLLVLLPTGALAAQASSSMEVSVQVVRDYSAAATALIQAAGSSDPASAAINSGAQCKSVGNTVIVDGAWASCSWDADNHVYLVTVQY